MRSSSAQAPSAAAVASLAVAFLATALLVARCAPGPGGRSSGQNLLLVSDRAGAWRIYEVDPADGTARAFGAPRDGASRDGASRDTMPARLPDGRVVFVSDRDGPPAIYLASADGDDVRRLTHGPADPAPGAADSDPAPLGRERVLFARSDPGAPQGSPRDLFVVGTDGAGLRRLTHDAADDHAPAGSADGRRVVFVSDRSGAPRLMLIRDVDAADPPEAAPLAASPPARPGPGTGETSIADDAPAFLADGSIVFSRVWGAGPPHLFATDGEGWDPRVRQVTDALTLPWGADEPVPLPDGTLLLVTGPVPPPKGMEGPPRYAMYRIAAGGYNVSRITRDQARYDDFTRRLAAR